MFLVACEASQLLSLTRLWSHRVLVLLVQKLLCMLLYLLKLLLLLLQ